MNLEEDWVLRPVLQGLCNYESLTGEGKLNLVDIAKMNEALDVREENLSRIAKRS
jgi:hypothetical protein